MPQFYTFPGSCAVQVLAGFADGVAVPQELTQRHRLTLAVVMDNGRQDGKLKALGMRKIGTFNKAHQATGKLALWAAGSEFKTEGEAENGDIKTQDSRNK